MRCDGRLEGASSSRKNYFGALVVFCTLLASRPFPRPAPTPQDFECLTADGAANAARVAAPLGDFGVSLTSTGATLTLADPLVFLQGGESAPGPMVAELT